MNILILFLTVALTGAAIGIVALLMLPLMFLAACYFGLSKVVERKAEKWRALLSAI